MFTCKMYQALSRMKGSKKLFTVLMRAEASRAIGGNIMELLQGTI